MSRVKSSAKFADAMVKDRFHKLVGDRVWHVREEAGISQSALAREIGASQSTINNIETGQSCSLFVLALVAEALDVTLDELIPLEATR